ncbi:hypothetical protein HQ590_03245 [bacterium]|nr:hypothetical protein [bacterium]
MKKALLALALVFAGELFLVWLAWTAYNAPAHRAWVAYQREARARGIRFDIVELAPPPVPDDENFAALPMFAALFDPTRSNEAARAQEVDLESLARRDTTPCRSATWREGLPTDLGSWAVSLGGSSNSVTAGHDVLTGLQPIDGQLDFIARASQRPAARFPVRYEEGFRACLPHLNVLRSWARVYSLRASAALAAGASRPAADDVLVSLRFAESLSNEPFLLSGLVRLSLIEQSLQPVWEGLDNHTWSTTDLERLGSALAAIDLVAGCRFTLRGERALGTGTCTMTREKPELLFGLAGPLRLIRLLPGGLWDRGLLLLNRGYDQLEICVDVPARRFSPGAARAFNEYVGTLEQRRRPSVLLARLLLPALDAATKKFAQTQAAVDQARVACALERYWLAHREYPGALAALAPEFLDAVPHDVIGVGPLHYEHVGADKFRLWSVGWNETDDGGRVVMTQGRQPRPDPDQGDWVWPAPAPPSL